MILDFSVLQEGNRRFLPLLQTTVSERKAVSFRYTNAEYVAENGEEHLLAALKRNEECGVLYHYDGQLTGDYDLFQRKEEVIAFLERGLQN